MFVVNVDSGMTGALAQHLAGGIKLPMVFLGNEGGDWLGISWNIIPYGYLLSRAICPVLGIGNAERYSFAEHEHVTNPYRPTNVGFGLTYTLPVIVAVLSSRPGRSLVL